MKGYVYKCLTKVADTTVSTISLVSCYVIVYEAVYFVIYLAYSCIEGNNS